MIVVLLMGAVGALSVRARPCAAASPRDYLSKPDAWFQSAEGRRLTANILSWQSRHGGWPKNTDTTTRPFTGDPKTIQGTFDNGATTNELRFLARVCRATTSRQCLQAFLKGLAHILEAQYPTGGWPQFHPPSTFYHRHITFNDDAMVRLMRFLRDVATSGDYAFLGASPRQAARASFDRGLRCILKCQIVVNGRKTVWCAQHDEKTFAPRPGRSYELVSLSGGESVGILRLLMSIDNPSQAVVDAVVAGAEWYKSSEVTGDAMRAAGMKSPGWGRFYDIATNRPIFSGRDGVKKFSITQIEAERAKGYSWWGRYGDTVAREYAKWKRRHADRWEPAFKAGMIDRSTGKPIRGTEIIHLAAHKGRLYAGNGYWMDTRGYQNVPWSQVLVLDSPSGTWKVDLTLGRPYLRVTVLESVTFTTDGAGKALAPPVNLLLAASDIQGGPRESNIWTRDDDKGTWVKTTLEGRPEYRKYRRSTRAVIVHRDRRTGVDRIFVAAGALGIYRGVFDANQPGRIRWDRKAELGPVAIRPMSFAEANGSLYASAGVSVYRRKDGPAPVWEKVYSDNTREHWELGGIRGLTAVRSPNGAGESILFSHTDRIIRLDPKEDHKATVELRIRPLLQKSWAAPVPGSIIAAYSDMMPLKDPTTGRTVHILGVQGRIERGGRDRKYRGDTFFGWYAGGSYLIRESDRSYRLQEVNGRWAPGKPKLVAPRTFVVSPFPADAGGQVYCGGFDANFFPALDTAWIFRAAVKTVLRVAP